MYDWKSAASGITDGHAHMLGISEENRMLAAVEVAGIEKMNLVAIQNHETGSGLPEAFYMKSRHPGKFYVFAGLNHAAKITGGKVCAPRPDEQVEAFIRIGCDGVKMIEGKPTARRMLNIPVTDSYYEAYWARLEETGFPAVWHVNDPEEFWDPQRIPAWAKAQGWGYGPEDSTKEQLYAEVDEVLRRHPGLKIIFAHFYFLSADLDRAARFLDAHPAVCFDLAPGVEMLYNISRDPQAGRDFFIRYSDRIVFGTDIFSALTADEARFRAGIIYRWLETDDAFRVPHGADFLLGPPEDGEIIGMSLPTDVLQRIYYGNFARIAGHSPAPLDESAAAQECRRLAKIAAEASGRRIEETEAGRIVSLLEK